MVTLNYIHGSKKSHPLSHQSYMSTLPKRLLPHRCENFKTHTSTTFLSTHKRFSLRSAVQGFTQK